MFINALESDPFFFVCVVVTVVVSIVLHELAHGVAAIWQGDDTPIKLGHMTANPIVHMGWFSLILLAMVGLAYGRMPVNPSRFRSRFGNAMVAAAGPITNVLLAGLALTGLGLWSRFQAGDVSSFQANAQDFLWYFGYINVTLAGFNLIPVPPLDGSAILADFSPGYARLARNPQHQNIFFFALLAGLFLLDRAGEGLFGYGAEASRLYLNWVKSGF